MSQQENAAHIVVLEEKLQASVDETEVLRRQCKIGRLMQARSVDSAGEAVQRWLCHTVKLPQYADTLLDNGFDDFDCFAGVTDEILEEIGIAKLGHRHKLMRCASRLDGSLQQQRDRQSDCISHIWSDDSVQYSAF